MSKLISVQCPQCLRITMVDTDPKALEVHPNVIGVHDNLNKEGFDAFRKNKLEPVGLGELKDVDNITQEELVNEEPYVNVPVQNTYKKAHEVTSKLSKGNK